MDVEGGHRIGEMVRFGRPDDRGGDDGLAQHPGHRHLRHPDAAFRGNLLNGLDDGLVEPGAKLCAMAVGMVSNFLGYRFVFRGPSPAPTDSTDAGRS